MTYVFHHGEFINENVSINNEVDRFLNLSKKIAQENSSLIFCISRDHSSTIPHQQKQFTQVNNLELINIIQNEFTKPSIRVAVSNKDVIIQCSSDEFDNSSDQSANVLFGRLSATLPMDSLPIPIRPGCKECGIQADFREYQLDLLMKIYSDRLSTETIEYFYEICHSDFQETCTQIDEYLQNSPAKEIPIEISNTPSVEEEIFEEIPHQISISSSTVHSLEELYGQLPDKSSLTSTSNELLLPFDDDLSRNLHQAIERYFIRSNQTNKPVNKKQTNTQWKSTIDVQTNHVPSLREIINEEQRAVQSQKTKQVLSLNFLAFSIFIHSGGKKRRSFECIKRFGKGKSCIFYLQSNPFYAC